MKHAINVNAPMVRFPKPKPERKDDTERWQWDLANAIPRLKHGWRAFVPALDWDSNGQWQIEGDDRSDHERLCDARENPWIAYLSMPGYLDTSAHCRGTTAKEALHEMICEALYDSAPAECTPEAYAECQAALGKDHE